MSLTIRVGPRSLALSPLGRSAAESVDLDDWTRPWPKGKFSAYLDSLTPMPPNGSPRAVKPVSVRGIAAIAGSPSALACRPLAPSARSACSAPPPASSEEHDSGDRGSDTWVPRSSESSECVIHSVIRAPVCKESSDLCLFFQALRRRARHRNHRTHRATAAARCE